MRDVPDTPAAGHLARAIRIGEKDVLCLETQAKGSVQILLRPRPRKTYRLELASQGLPYVLLHPQDRSPQEVADFFNGDPRFRLYVERVLRKVPAGGDVIAFPASLALATRPGSLELVRAADPKGGSEAEAMRQKGTLARILLTPDRQAALYASATRLVLAGGDGEAPKLAYLLRIYLRGLAAEDLPRFVCSERFPPELAAKLDKVGVMDAATRWGSLSSVRGRRGRYRMHVNWRGLLLQPELLRHLVCHEYSHTHAMNHQQSFYAFLAKLSPRWQTLERQLDRAWRTLPLWSKGKTPAK
ncbi:MAG: M48 family metallopeptidase [Desulfovibrio sp.]|nr:M48 family metallopeptidase [Desulfovibrio sp.]